MMSTKLRVLWKRNENSRCFIVKNKLLVTRKKSKFASVNKAHSSKYIHSLNQFPYAGQVLRTSFNSFLPERSGIKKKVLEKSRKTIREDIEKTQFFAKFSKEEVEIEEVAYLGNVNNMIDEIVKTFSFNLNKHDKRGLSELMADFLQDENGNWRFLKCKAHKIEYLPIKTTQNPLLSPQMLQRSLLNTEVVKDFYESIKNKRYAISPRNRLTPEILMQRLNKIEFKNMNFHSKRPSFIDMADILSDNIKLYASNKPDFQSPVPHKYLLSPNYLNTIASKYDQFRQSARLSIGKLPK